MVSQQTTTQVLGRVMALAAPAPADASLDSIETPAAVVDLSVMAQNLVRTAEYCQRNQLTYRPHTKTHKSPVIGSAQLEAGARGLTVATLREAEVMADVCDDLLLAYPPVGGAKLTRLTQLAQRVGRLTVALDSPEALAGVATAARDAAVKIGVVIELDVGMGRVGVQTVDDAVRLAGAVADNQHLHYQGVLFYPGHIRETPRNQDEVLRSLNIRLEQFLAGLQAAALVPETVSGGSTPSLWRSHEVQGVTEVRAGTTVFNDRTTVAIDACRWDECAYTVLATVVSTAVPGQAVVDAGSKALSREELRGSGGGYGALYDRPEVVLKSLSEEHGLLDLSVTSWRPRVGDRVRIVPNHVCVSVNLQEQVWGEMEERLVCRWPVAARGRAAAGTLGA